MSPSNQRNIMKRFFLLSSLVFALTVPVVHADDAVRAAQTVLQSAGYYAGAVDGELNAETKGALRRYQIRNQLEATGELTPETIVALNKESENAPAATPATPSPQPPTPAPEQPLPPSAVPQSPPGAVQGIPLPPPGVPAPSDPALAAMFSHTPYADAAPEIQFGIILKAQRILAERGIYHGVADGRPGPATTEALLRFQGSKTLPRTGRLDIDTLAALHLLPVAKLRSHGVPQPFTPPVPPPGRGAVRGVPLD